MQTLRFIISQLMVDWWTNKGRPFSSVDDSELWMSGAGGRPNRKYFTNAKLFFFSSNNRTACDAFLVEQPAIQDSEDSRWQPWKWLRWRMAGEAEVVIVDDHHHYHHHHHHQHHHHHHHHQHDNHHHHHHQHDNHHHHQVVTVDDEGEEEEETSDDDLQVAIKIFFFSFIFTMKSCLWRKFQIAHQDFHPSLWRSTLPYLIFVSTITITTIIINTTIIIIINTSIVIINTTIILIIRLWRSTLPLLSVTTSL